MEYTAYFYHNSYESDQFFVMTVTQPSADLMACLDTTNYFWELLVSTGKLPDDSFLAEVRSGGKLLWSADSQDA